MKTRYSARSDVGLKREINQDAYGVEPTSGEGPIRLLVVCDGMGGHAAGEVASRIGVEKILAYYRADPTGKPQDLLGNAFVEANHQIYTQGRGTMGTTGVAAILHDYTLHVANVGDSRAYLIREGTIRQISRDHSLVSDQIAAGLMTTEQARASNFRNIITRALGHQPQVDVDHFVNQLHPGDIVLLSSDGMHGLIEDGEIAEIFTRLPFERAVERLIELANERGGTDNITVVAAQVDPSGDPPVAADDDTATLPTLPLVTPAAGTTRPAAAPLPEAPARPVPAAPPPDRPLRRSGLLLAALMLVVVFASGAYLLFAAPPPDPLPPIFAGETPTAEATPPSPTVATVSPSPAPATATTTRPPATATATLPPETPTRSATTRASATRAPTRTPTRTTSNTATGTGVTPSPSSAQQNTGTSASPTRTAPRPGAPLPTLPPPPPTLPPSPQP